MSKKVSISWSQTPHQVATRKEIDKRMSSNVKGPSSRDTVTSTARGRDTVTSLTSPGANTISTTITEIQKRKSEVEAKSLLGSLYGKIGNGGPAQSATPTTPEFSVERKVSEVQAKSLLGSLYGKIATTTPPSSPKTVTPSKPQPGTIPMTGGGILDVKSFLANVYEKSGSESETVKGKWRQVNNNPKEKRKFSEKSRQSTKNEDIVKGVV